MDRGLLLDVVQNGGKQLWCGRNQPFSMDCLDIGLCTNYRVSERLHGTYDCVWYYEDYFDELGEFEWRLALDEIIRLLKEDGRLIIRMRKNNLPTLYQVKKFLGRNPAFSCDIEYEFDAQHTEKVSTILYRIKRKRFIHHFRK